jgi:hypothetical protein
VFEKPRFERDEPLRAGEFETNFGTVIDSKKTKGKQGKAASRGVLEPAEAG